MKKNPGRKKYLGILLLFTIGALAAGCRNQETADTAINKGNIAQGNRQSEQTDNEYENAAKVGAAEQTVTTRFSARSYAPITVQVGVPVKWTIQMEPQDLNGCNNEIYIDEYKLAQKLSSGETIVEFTPEETGVVPYSCWMGMIRGSINVVDDLAIAE